MLGEKAIHDRSCHESERPMAYGDGTEPMEFKTLKDAEEFFPERDDWTMTNIPPVRILFDGPADVFAWPDDIRFLRVEHRWRDLWDAYDAIFEWSLYEHWTCRKNAFGSWRPKIYEHTPADEIVNLVRGGS